MKYDHQPQPDIEPDELFPCKDERCEDPRVAARRSGGGAR